jgi:hypothetical protein
MAPAIFDEKVKGIQFFQRAVFFIVSSTLSMPNILTFYFFIKNIILPN